MTVYRDCEGNGTCVQMYYTTFIVLKIVAKNMTL